MIVDISRGACVCCGAVPHLRLSIPWSVLERLLAACERGDRR